MRRPRTIVAPTLCDRRALVRTWRAYLLQLARMRADESTVRMPAVKPRQERVA